MVTLRWHAVACGRPPGWPIAECGTQCAEDAQITGDGTTALNTRSVGMELYCTCGYPIWVSAKWDGQDFHLLLHDGHAGRHGMPLSRCPRCLRRLDVSELDRLPPMSSFPRWPFDGERTG